MGDDELWRETATALALRIRRRELSAAEVVGAHLSRIEEVNPELNAIVTLDREGALAAADEADRALARGGPAGVLHGLPIAVKDLEDTAGMRTTYGSPPLPRSRAGRGHPAGHAVAQGRGDRDRQDVHGSVRNPAGFCGLVGLRPSAGRIPEVPTTSPWSPLAVHGPIARTVEDAALLLRALCGPDPRAPLSLDDPPRDLRGRRSGRPRCAADRVERRSGRPARRAGGHRRAAAATRRSSKRSGARSRTPSRTSALRTRRSRPCAASGSRTRSASCCAAGATSSRTR